MRDIKIRFQERVELTNRKRHNGLYSIYEDYTDDMKEVEELIKKIDKKLKVAENEFWITMEQAKEERRILI